MHNVGCYQRSVTGKSSLCLVSQLQGRSPSCSHAAKQGELKEGSFRLSILREGLHTVCQACYHVNQIQFMLQMIAPASRICNPSKVSPVSRECVLVFFPENFCWYHSWKWKTLHLGCIFLDEPLRGSTCLTAQTKDKGPFSHSDIPVSLTSKYKIIWKNKDRYKQAANPEMPVEHL